MMDIQPFELERYFAQHEFSARYLLSSSDCEAFSQAALLTLADDEMQQAWEQLRLGYTETRGHPLLREEIGSLYAGLGSPQVLVAAPEELIFLLMQTLLRPGDHVICTFPGYQSLYELARSIGCQLSLWQPREERGWEFALEDLDQLMRPDTRLVVINFPHNPTGYLPDRADFLALVDRVRQHGAYLFSDEMYRYLELGEVERLPAACELYERAISLAGLSKAFGLPGLRIGWLASQQVALLDQVTRLKDYTTICNSAPSEILAIITLRSHKMLLAEQHTRLYRNLTILADFFDLHQHIFLWQEPHAGSVCFPRLIVMDDSNEFCRQTLIDTGILLVPSQVFHYGDHHLRIGFGRENLPDIIGIFSDYLNKRFRS